MGRDVQSQIAKLAIGSTVKHLSVPACKKFKINVPPISLQIQFSEIVKKADSVRDSYLKNLKELENLYGSISQRAFNGEFDLSKVDISDMENSKKKDLEEVKEDLTEDQFEDLLDSFEHNLPTGEVPSNRKTDIRNMRFFLSIHTYTRFC
jgi:type I restriction enzyme S subunit